MELDIREILQRATEQEASDIFIVTGCPLSIKTKGSIFPLDEAKLSDRKSVV